MADTAWFPAAYRDTLPEYAVIAAAANGDKGPTLVGRVFHETEMVPAMVMPDQKCAFYTKNGKEFLKSKYDVLVGHDYSWKPFTNHTMPSNAVVFDNQSNNEEEIYIGRVLYQDTMCVGKVDPVQNCLLFPYNGEELRTKSFDILVMEQSEDWLITSFHYTPPDAVEGGRDTDGAMIYVGRVFYKGYWLPCKVIPSKTCAYFCYEGMEVFVRDYQILRGQGYMWHQVYGHFIPPNAVSTGVTERGEPLYVGRGNFNRSLTPGLISLSEKCCTLPYGGRAVSVSDYEVLLR